MARYYAEQALGMLETVGMVPAIEACDKMLKAAEVELISYENVGSTLVTMFVKGDVAAVKSSVKAGVEAAEKIGKVTAHDTIPAPDPSDRRCGVDLRRRCAMQRARGSIHIAGARFARNLRHRLLHPRSRRHVQGCGCGAGGIREHGVRLYLGDRRGRCRRLQDGSCCRCESCRRNGQGSLQLGGHRASASWDQKDHSPVFAGKIAACSSGIKTLNTRMATGKR